MAVGLPLKTTYANGDVYSASDVNDTNGTINLFQTSTLSAQAGKNAVINGGMDIWQRGTSFTTSNNQYTADRLQYYNNGANFTVSQQTATAPTGFQYYARWQRNAASVSTTASYLGMNLETKDSLRFAGQTITFSFYARKGANYSGASSNLALNISSGTGTDQNNISGAFTGATVLTNTTATLTTSFQRFTYTVTVGSTATQLGFYWTFTGVGTAGAADYVEITGIQMELGSYATTFSRAGGTIQGELAACKRYYSKSYNFDVFAAAATTAGGVGIFWGTATTGAIRVYAKLEVEMRTAPTLAIYDGGGNGAGTCYKGGYNKTAVTYNIGTTGFTAGTTDATNANEFFYQYTASAEL
jgi:hypothetical protein